MQILAIYCFWIESEHNYVLATSKNEGEHHINKNIGFNIYQFLL